MGIEQQQWIGATHYASRVWVVVIDSGDNRKCHYCELMQLTIELYSSSCDQRRLTKTWSSCVESSYDNYCGWALKLPKL